MLIISRVILGIIVIIMAGYSLITSDYSLQPYITLFLSLMIFVMGLEEFKKGRKVYGWIGMIIFLFVLLIALYSFSSN